jgi:outer membrane protein assembly complex protein YaeT
MIRLPAAAGGGVRLPGFPGGEKIELDVEIDGSGDIRLENSLLAAVLRGRMAVSGTAAEPELSGRLRARSGEVRLFPGVFLPIRELKVELPRGAGAEPSARFRSVMQAGRVRVSVGISGPLAAPRLSLTSEPPYPQDELLGLLVYGRTPGGLGRGAEARAAMQHAGRLLGGFALDHMPRAEPSPSLLSRLVLDFESSAGRRAGSVWQRSEGGTATYIEYVINDFLSFIAIRDADGRFSGDVQVRFAWPRPRRRRAGRPSARETGAGAAGDEVPRPEPFFEGNRAFGGNRLLAVLAPELRRGGAPGWTPAAVSDAIFRLRHLYLEAGYYFVRIECRPRDGSVVFSVEEGPRVRLGRVNFAGNREVPEAGLRRALFSERPAVFSSPFTSRLLDAQNESLLAFYREEGYLQARLERPVLGYDERRGRMNVTYRISEGRRFVLGDVLWRGAPEGRAERLAELARTEVGEPLRASLPQRLAFAARDYLRQEGHPVARAEARLELRPTDGTGTVTVDLHPGEAVRIREVRVSGNRRVRPDFIRGASRLREGARLITSRLRRAEKRLVDTGLFREVLAVPAGLERPGERLSDIELRVTEATPHEFDLRAGYGAFERLRAGMGIGTRNAFGNGESMSLAASVNSRGYRLDADAGLIPSPGRPIRLGAHAFYEERDDVSYELRDLGVSPLASYRPSPRDEVSLGLLFEWIETDDVALGVPAGDQRDFLLAAPFLTLSHDRRDSVLLPSRGYIAAARLEAADQDVYGDISYWRASGTAAGYLNVARWLTLACSLQGGIVSPFGDTEEVPIALRYFAGGAGTVRGFEERSLGPEVDDEPTGGEVYLAAQTELRFRIWRDLYGAAFLDAGNVWADARDTDLSDLRYGTGPGLRYRTPVGTIGLDVGFNPSPEDPDEEKTQLHLTLGLSF